MAKVMVECRVCKQKFNRLDPDLVEGVYWVQPVKKFYYHKKCYEDFAKKKGQIGKEGIELEADELVWKTAVEDYLKRDLKISIDYKKFNLPDNCYCLQKPIRVSELTEILEIILKASDNKVPHIEVRTEKETVYVLEHDIMYIIPDGRFIQIHLKNLYLQV